MLLLIRFSSCLIVPALWGISVDATPVRQKTTFDLYFDKNSLGQRMVTGNVFSFVAGNFDTCKKTVFIVTGFNQPDSHPDIIKAARAFAVKNYNTIVVNFETLEYFRAPTITGRDIAEFLKYLTDLFKYDREHITLIGISLGTHVVGVAGYFFPGLGRILAYGSLRRHTGHVNYVLNGGLVQPGCPWLEPGTKMPNFGCNHLRGAYLMLASISDCEFKFSKCPGHVEYLMGLCRNEPTLVYGMGLDVKTAPRDGSVYYYDVTQLKYPFCTDGERVNPDFSGRIC